MRRTSSVINIGIVRLACNVYTERNTESASEVASIGFHKRWICTVTERRHTVVIAMSEIVYDRNDAIKSNKLI